MPTLNANDTSCILRRWLADDGALVERDAPIAILETSKAAFELPAGVAGILHRLVDVEHECAFGATIGYLLESAAARGELAAEPPPAAGLTITESARALMNERGLDECALAGLGKQVIRRADVQALLQANQPTIDPALTRRQAAVAKTVIESHQTIPAAFLVTRIWCDDLISEIRAWSKERRLYAGVPEALVKVVGSLLSEFPIFFCSASGAVVRDANVGITVDVGKGLFIPVVKRSTTSPLATIAGEMMRFREKANEDRFTFEDLDDGHISISLTTERALVFSVPLILPPQRCMISVGDTFEELTMRSDQTLSMRRYVNLGIAYDHRYINGSDAANFVQAIKKRCEPGLVASGLIE